MKRMKNKYDVHDLVVVEGESHPIKMKLKTAIGWKYFVNRKWIWERDIQPDFAKDVPEYGIE
jgi:hypothetical protein